MKRIWLDNLYSNWSSDSKLSFVSVCSVGILFRTLNTWNFIKPKNKAQSNAVKWESKWTHIQNTAAKKTLLLGRIKIATHNLYQVIADYADVGD